MNSDYIDETVHKISQKELEEIFESAEKFDKDKTELTLEELDEIFIENFTV